MIVNRDCLQLRMIDAKFQPRFRNVSELPVTARLRLFSFDGEQRADLVSLITRGQTTWDLPTLGPGQEAALDIDVQLILANSTVTFVLEDEDGQPLGKFGAGPGEITVTVTGWSEFQDQPMFLMLHGVNGREKFDIAQPSERVKQLTDAPPHSATAPTRAAAVQPAIRVTPALVRAMLLRESSLRKTDLVQRMYVERGVIPVTAEVQRHVAREFGFSDPDVGMEIMRTAEALFPDADMRNASHWRKYNRASQGTMAVGDNVAHIPLLTLDGQHQTLGSVTRCAATTTTLAPSRTEVGDDANAVTLVPGRPTVLVCGSYS